MFDALIREAAQRFHLGDKAGPFIGLLAGLLFNSHGGINGLRERFASQGLGDEYNRWIGGSPGDNVLQPDQFAGAFGEEHVGHIASRLKLPLSAVTLAGAALLPKLVALLTPGGRIPQSIPAEAVALLDDSPRGYAQAHALGTAPAHQAGEGGIGRWLKWLFPLIVAVVVLLMVRRCIQTGPETPPAAPAGAATAATTPAREHQPRFDFRASGGKVSVGGLLASEAERDRLWNALQTSFGAGNVEGRIEVDPATLQAGWLDQLIAALPSLKDDGLDFGFDGDHLRIDSSALPEEQRYALSGKLRQLFAGHQTSGLWDRASAALSTLGERAGSAKLVQALNLMEIHFDTGSATITGDSNEILSTAADAIIKAGGNSRIEVGGHTDNTGDAAANHALSQHRAEAVVERLEEKGVPKGVLTPRGYGPNSPRADNDTEEGRAQNRRIEFRVLP